jgi:hypothetical protein
VYMKTGPQVASGEGGGNDLNRLAGAAPPAKPDAANPLAKAPTRSWWLQCEFTTPQAQWGGCESKFDDHTLIVLPFVDPNRVKQIGAWINGQPVEVQTYRYPRNRAMCCRWIDIVGTAVRPGGNQLVLQMDLE